MIITIKDVIEHLKTMPSDTEVWMVDGETSEYYPAPRLLGRLVGIKKETDMTGQTLWEVSHDDEMSKVVCVLLPNTKSEVL